MNSETDPFFLRSVPQNLPNNALLIQDQYTLPVNIFVSYGDDIDPEGLKAWPTREKSPKRASTELNKVFEDLMAAHCLEK